MLLCTPDHYSPTLATMPEDRRKAIAAVARKFGVTILENAVYRPLSQTGPPPLSSFAPELSYYFTSFSKFCAPGLRVGFLVVPAGRADSLLRGMGATMWMAPSVNAEIVTRWITDGTMDQLMIWQRNELTKRNELAAEAFGDLSYISLATGLHVWLKLPMPWRASTFVSQARSRGVLVRSAEFFATGRKAVPHAIRISLGGTVPARKNLAGALQTLVDTLRSKPEVAYAIS